MASLFFLPPKFVAYIWPEKSSSQAEAHQLALASVFLSRI
jgi:hypothetical protein